MSLKTDITAALADASDIITGIREESYTSAAEAKAAINTVRTELAELLDQVDDTYGAKGGALIAALEGVGARLLDLRELLDDSGAVIEETTTAPTSLAELALAAYGDWTRWTEMVPLNPWLHHPGFVPQGAVVKRYAS